MLILFRLDVKQIWIMWQYFFTHLQYVVEMNFIDLGISVKLLDLPFHIYTFSRLYVKQFKDQVKLKNN